MRKLLVITALAVMLPAPAFALTLEQAMAEVAGYYCAGSTCTTAIAGSRGERYLARHTGPKTGMPEQTSGDVLSCPWGKSGRYMRHVSPITCTANSLVLEGGHDEYDTRPIPTLTTISKELIYNGPETDRAHAWTVNTSTSTVDCPCN